MTDWKDQPVSSHNLPLKKLTVLTHSVYMHSSRLSAVMTAGVEAFIFLIDAPNVAATWFHSRFTKHLTDILQEARKNKVQENEQPTYLGICFTETRDSSGKRTYSFPMRRIVEPSWVWYDHRYDVEVVNGQVERLYGCTQCKANIPRVVHWLDSILEEDPTVSIAQFSVSIYLFLRGRNLPGVQD